MSNGQRCCILGICCPPGSPAQISALADYMREAAGEDVDEQQGRWHKVAAKLLAEFKIRSE